MRTEQLVFSIPVSLRWLRNAQSVESAITSHLFLPKQFYHFSLPIGHLMAYHMVG